MTYFLDDSDSVEEIPYEFQRQVGMNPYVFECAPSGEPATSDQVIERRKNLTSLTKEYDQEFLKSNTEIDQKRAKEARLIQSHRKIRQLADAVNRLIDAAMPTLVVSNSTSRRRPPTY